VAASIIKHAGEQFVTVPGSPIRHAGLTGSARALCNAVRSTAIARRILRAEEVRLALGFGGFASGGVILAARTLGLAAAILEANVEFGLANRWLRPCVNHVFHGLGLPPATFDGVPVRPSVLPLIRLNRQPPSGALRILVTSGSRGADFFADRLPPVLHRLASAGIPVQVWQQTPAPDRLRERYRELAVEATVETFIADIADAYTWADIAIARGGANTIAELAIAGLPALIVPLADAAANHQQANGELWQCAGGGVTFSERDWSGDAVTAWLQSMATDPQCWRAHARAARDLARPGAAGHIAEECLRLAQRSQ
jgi:UDP-N-acetylglucosamine--N-acetylmuramyl-(pentapeptide) pyrophosphoryl-undecaprenol N-acetylglucosamine transferase